MTETIKTRSGIALQVGKEAGPKALELTVKLQNSRDCVLHWGLRENGREGWKLPPQPFRPAKTEDKGAALQTPLSADNGGIVIRLPAPMPYSSLDFALFFPEEKSWDNNQGRNYRIELGTSVPISTDRATAAPPGPDVAQALTENLGDEKPLFQRVFEIEAQGKLAVAVTKKEGRFVVSMLTNIPNALLHWGMARYTSYEWSVPPESVRPAGTFLWEGQTAQTPFVENKGLGTLRVEIPETDAPMGIQFVLKQGEGNRWLRYRGGNFFVPVRIDYAPRAGIGAPELTSIANEIIQAETMHNSWTLMHRYNLCFELLERVGDNADGLALLFVWLRYSAVRQLTWQKNFNTKPRELSHAQDRLTGKLAELYRSQPKARSLLRLMLASVGPGGEGQRIRDEILNIMHRHHVKEVSGHFLEEWHQKLHNNTTPDDIAICEAYLEFLYSNGNRDTFYSKLQERGVTRERLQSFERPIRTDPDFVPHIKDGLIHDFQNFLRILRSVHEGTDLETAISAARSRLDGDTQGLLGRIWEHRHGQVSLKDLVEEITEARRRLYGRINDAEASRELLYLDLALEQFLRLVVERSLQASTDGDTLVEVTARVLESRQLSSADAELGAATKHWERLKAQPRFGADWSLHAKSVVDRIARVLGELIDRAYRLLQPKAELLGHAFHADAWVITLFSEEVVRGSSLDFALSMLLRGLEPQLRKAARLGNWQIVSRGRGAGKVELVNQLREVQGKTFDGPRVVVADHVSGDEDIPAAVSAVIAPDVTDIVSHVAVRARNAGLLFASCYDHETFNRIKTMQGRHVRVEIDQAGDVKVEEGQPEMQETKRKARTRHAPVSLPKSTQWVLSAAEFTPELTGGKSINLTGLKGKLPEWIGRPGSIVIPFGAFERVLAAPENKATATAYTKAIGRLESDAAKTLPELRELVQKLQPPAELEKQLRQKATEAKIPWPAKGEDAWGRIKQVWASKWNERAYFSRRTEEIPHESLLMAVLVQQVIEADYAFVAHTVNPFSNKQDEVYLEMVVGLGETLVGNYPGRALSAVCDKTSKKATLLSYPSKSIALHGGGVIFRSDSNGEDLAGFAGAGLYDSVMLPEPRPESVDYAQEKMVWDETFRNQTLQKLTELSVAVERALGAPQDIEGVVSKGKYFIVQTRPQVGVRT